MQLNCASDLTLRLKRSLRLHDYQTFVAVLQNPSFQNCRIWSLVLLKDSAAANPFLQFFLKVDLGYITSKRRGMMFINCTFSIPEKGNIDFIVFHEKAKRTQQGNLLACSLVQMNSYG